MSTLAITVLVDDQYPLAVRSRAWLQEQQTEATLLHVSFLPI
jgi:hypothetical protein